MRDEMIQPDGQTASLLAEWRRGVLLIPVSIVELGVVCGGEEQNDENNFLAQSLEL